MLTDEQLEQYANQVSEKFSKINSKYLKKMGEQVKQIGLLSPTNVSRLDQMIILGANINELKRDLAYASAKSLKEMEKIYKQLYLDAYRDSKYLFHAINKTQLTLEEDLPLQAYIDSMLQLTNGTFTNLANTTILDDTYKTLIDNAINIVYSGLDDYTTVMKSHLKQASVGARVEYSSGLTRRLDSAVRMNVLSGVRQVNMGIRNYMGEQFNADGVELSAHFLCAPDHLPMQGKQFSKDEFAKLQSEQSSKSYDGEHYGAIRRSIGQWNCKHYTFPIILGISTSAYTSEQLQAYKENSNKMIEIDGKYYTKYECSQLMRRAETSMRYTKDTYILARESGNNELMVEQSNRLAKQRKAYKLLCEKAELKPEWDRTYVPNFKK